MTQPLATTPNYKAFVLELRARVQSAQIRAARAANRELLALYWDIGRLISEKQKASGWGDNVVGLIAEDLARALGGARGFSRANLYYMKQWYGFYQAHVEIVQQAVGQIPWGHNIQIIQKVKDAQQAIWYVQQTLENGWSRNVLALRIDSHAYERQAVAPTLDQLLSDGLGRASEDTRGWSVHRAGLVPRAQSSGR